MGGLSPAARERDGGIKRRKRKNFVRTNDATEGKIVVSLTVRRGGDNIDIGGRTNVAEGTIRINEKHVTFGKIELARKGVHVEKTTAQRDRSLGGLWGGRKENRESLSERRRRNHREKHRAIKREDRS